MDDRLAQMIADHLAGTLSDADGHELVRQAAQDSEIRAAVQRQELTHRLLRARTATSRNIGSIVAALPRAPTSRSVMARLPQRSRLAPRLPITWISTAAAALVLIALGWWSLHRSRQAPAWTVVAMTGEAQLLVDGEIRPLRVRDDVVTGQSLHLMAAGSVRLRAADGSTLDLGDAARVTVVQAGAFERRLVLEQGRVQALVATLRTGERFVLQTLQVEVTVIGTRFTVTVADQATSVAVDEGIVSVQPAQGPVEQLVAGKHNRWPLADQPKPKPVEASRLVEVRPDADADADASQPSSSFGLTPGLRLQGGGKRRVSLLRFTVPQGRIASAELVLHRTNGNATVQVCLQETVGGWQENDLRWHHVPAKGRIIDTLHEQDGVWRCQVPDLHPGTAEFYLETTEGTTSFGSREMTGQEPMLRLRLSN